MPIVKKGLMIVGGAAAAAWGVEFIRTFAREFPQQYRARRIVIAKRREVREAERMPERVPWWQTYEQEEC